MMALLGAIAFDNNIRGMLVVAVGTLVLGGSVYAIVASNSGLRAGFLIVCAGLFGWMFLMGTIWWIYGIGLKGRDPAWMPLELNYSRAYPVATDVVNKLPEPDKLYEQFDPVDYLNETPLAFAVAIGTEGKDSNGNLWEPETLTNVVTELTTQVSVEAADVPNLRKGIETNAGDYIAEHPSVAEDLELSDEALAEKISSDAEKQRSKIEDALNGWCLLSETDSRRGETVASSDANLAEGDAFGDTTSTSSYIVQDVFFYGGKEPCTPITEKSIWSRAWHRVATTFEVKNPKLYGVVTVVKALQQPTIAGQAPPTPKIEPGASTVSMVMLRNLGNRRLIPAVFTIINLILFAIFAGQLHVRDKRAMAARAAFEASN